MTAPETENRLVAILRGVRPEEVADHIAALIGAGFRTMEIPLNSPDPFASIAVASETAERLAPGECLIGAGTVLTAEEAARVSAAGGRLVVSPNADAAVIRATRDLGMMSLPGVMTPTEAFAALAAGASGLKLFPAFLLGPSGVKAIRAVLPPETRLWAVGGLGADAIGGYLDAGAYGFGFGSEVYRPGSPPDATRAGAARLASAFQSAMARA